MVDFTLNNGQGETRNMTGSMDTGSLINFRYVVVVSAVKEQRSEFPFGKAGSSQGNNTTESFGAGVGNGVIRKVRRSSF